MGKKNRAIASGIMMYAHLDTPSSTDNKYGLTLLISKDDTEVIKKIEEAIEYAKLKAIDKWGGKIPKNLKNPVHDGDEEKPDKTHFKNCLYLNAKSVDPPQIVDKNVKPIEDRSEVYSGCYVNVSLVFYGYNFSGNKGIGVWLGNIQKVKDGPRLGNGRISAADEFDVID